MYVSQDNAVSAWIQTDGRQQLDNTFWMARENKQSDGMAGQQNWTCMTICCYGDLQFTKNGIKIVHLLFYVLTLVMHVAVKCSFFFIFNCKLKWMLKRLFKSSFILSVCAKCAKQLFNKLQLLGEDEHTCMVKNLLVAFTIKWLIKHVTLSILPTFYSTQLCADCLPNVSFSL